MRQIIKNTKTRSLLLASLLLALPGAELCAQVGKVVQSAAEVGYPPFCMLDQDGQASGFAVDLLRATLGKMNREVGFRTGVWEEVFNLLKDGEVDVLPLVGRTPEREDVFDFTFPYLTMRGVLVYRAEGREFYSLADLSGHKVAVMKGDNSEEFLRREQRDFEIVSTETFSAALELLAEGGCDAVLMQRLVALRLIQESGLGEELQLSPRPVAGLTQEFCFAVREGDAETLSLLNDGLAIAIADGSKDRLMRKWFGRRHLASARSLVVGGDWNFPPYEFLDENGEPSGLNTEIMRAIAEEMGLDIEIRLGPWPETIKALREGRIDAIQGMFYSDARSRWFDFSHSYSMQDCSAVVRKDFGTPPTTLDELAGLNIVVQNGDIIHDYLLENNVPAEITGLASHEAAIEALAAGEYDCALLTLGTARHLLERGDLRNLRVSDKPLFAREYCIALPKGDQELLALFNEGLQGIKASGEFRRIYEKWMGIFALGFPLGTVLKYIAWIVLPLLFVLIIMLSFNWSLRRMVNLSNAELIASEARYRQYVDSTASGVFTIDGKGRLLDVNPGLCRMTGQKRDALIGWNLREIISGAEARDLFSDLGAMPDDAHASRFTQFKRIDGPRGWWKLEVAKAAENQLLCTATEISEQVESEIRIEHLNRVLRAIRAIDSMTKNEKNPETLSQKACDIIVEKRGYEAAWISLIDQDTKLSALVGCRIEGPIEHLKASIEAGDWPACCQFPVKDEDSGGYLVDRAKICGECPLAQILPGRDAFAAHLRHGGRSYGFIEVVVSDSTAASMEELNLFREIARDIGYALYSIEQEEGLAKAEAALQDSQKMEAIGKLAGGIAHDFNNMLMVILNYAKISSEELGENHPVNNYLREVVKAAERSARLTRQLLGFARRQGIVPRAVDLNSHVMETSAMLASLIGEDIRLSINTSEDLWQIKIDPGQLDQILTNLCVNARDAIDGNGRIEIRTANLELDEDALSDWPDAVPGEYVMLAVSDNGKGMSEETAKNAFAPFYTTKPLGEGTGLGLSTVYGIMQQNGGTVAIESRLGVGTSIKMYFPRLRDGEELDAQKSPRAHLMLVEDDELYRKSLELFLGRRGYDVLLAGSSEEALGLIERLESPIDLLITDVMLPGLDGYYLSEMMQSQYPDIITIFISGYPQEEMLANNVLPEGVRFLQKPFSPGTLAQMIERLLGQRGQ
jgi:two-component system, cell cycle sensor histidine kinase and response regulator CckA